MDLNFDGQVFLTDLESPSQVRGVKFNGFGLGAIHRPVGVPLANLFESQLQGPVGDGLPVLFRDWYTTRKSCFKKGLEHWKKLVNFVISKRPKILVKIEKFRVFPNPHNQGYRLVSIKTLSDKYPTR